VSQVLTRIKKLTTESSENAVIRTVLSIAPPTEEAARKVDSKVELKFWCKWFPDEMANGLHVFKTVEKAERDTIFHRLVPKSEKASKFKMDNIEVEEMIEAMELEARDSSTYLREVLSAARVISLRYFLSTSSELRDPEHEQLFININSSLVDDKNEDEDGNVYVVNRNEDQVDGMMDIVFPSNCITKESPKKGVKGKGQQGWRQRAQ
jgi:hypothetical protein